MDYWWIVFLYILSIMMIVKPEILWKIEHFLSVKMVSLLIGTLLL